jgi:hypothetical protein
MQAFDKHGTTSTRTATDDRKRGTLATPGPAARSTGSSGPSAPAGGLQPHPKNIEHRAKLARLEAAVARLRTEERQWRACQQKYGHLLSASAAAGAAAGASDEDEDEDEELISKFDGHRGVYSLLTDGVNSVFTTVRARGWQRSVDAGGTAARGVSRNAKLFHPRCDPPGSCVGMCDPPDVLCAPATATLQVDAMSRALQSTGAIIDAAPAAVAKASAAIRQASFPELGAESTKGLLRGVGALGGGSGAGERAACALRRTHRLFSAAAATSIAQEMTFFFHTCAPIATAPLLHAGGGIGGASRTPGKGKSAAAAAKQAATASKQQAQAAPTGRRPTRGAAAASVGGASALSAAAGLDASGGNLSDASMSHDAAVTGARGRVMRGRPSVPTETPAIIKRIKEGKK